MSCSPSQRLYAPTATHGEVCWLVVSCTRDIQLDVYAYVACSMCVLSLLHTVHPPPALGLPQTPTSCRTCFLSTYGIGKPRCTKVPLYIPIPSAALCVGMFTMHADRSSVLDMQVRLRWTPTPSSSHSAPSSMSASLLESPQLPQFGLGTSLAPTGHLQPALQVCSWPSHMLAATAFTALLAQHCLHGTACTALPAYLRFSTLCYRKLCYRKQMGSALY